METAPSGFRETPGGLLVPQDVPRAEQIWTKDEWRLLDRTTRLLNSRGVSLLMACQAPDCKGVKLARLRHADGTITLRCPHVDRVFRRAF